LGVTHKPEDSTNKEFAGSAALGGVPISLVEGEAWRQGTPLWNQYSAKYIPTARGTQHYYHTLNALNLGVQGVTGAAKAGIGYGAGRGARYLYDKATAAWHTPSEKTADHIGDRFLHGDEKGPRTSLPIEHLTALRDAVAKANATGIDHLPEKFRLPLPDGSHAIVEKYPGTGLSLKTLLSANMKSREPVISLGDLRKPGVDLKDWEALNKRTPGLEHGSPTAVIIKGNPKEKSAELQTALQPHQQRVVDRIQNQPGLVVAHGLGSGKTLSSIAAAEQLGGSTDVVLPAALKANYQKEIDKHLTGAPNAQYNLQSLQGLARSGISPQGNTLIVDEAHRLRNPGTKGYRAIQNSQAAHRLLLTGTPLYNRPHDLAVLVNLAAGQNVLPNSAAAFKAKYLGEKTIQPSWWDANIHGIHPGTVPIVTNKAELAPILQKWVDYHENAKEGFPDREDIQYRVPMDASQQSVYEGVLESAPGWISQKIKHNLPPSKAESKDLNAFLTAARQVSNTPHQYDLSQQENVRKGRVSPKIWKAYQEFQRQMDANPEHRAVIYSNYLESGLNPYAQLLDKKHIPYGMFTGDVDKIKRDQMVKDYNLGKLKALLLSSAGGEGLDLKGTRQMQILDPHFNKEKLEQVIGRGIRYKSHEALPEDQRKVRVEQYLSTLPEPGAIAKFFGSESDTSIDEYLQQMAKNKDALNQQMRELLKAKQSR
jgi:superfamily II DNA or RNA helicase